MAFTQSTAIIDSLGSLKSARGNWDGDSVETGELTTGLNDIFAVYVSVNDATAANGAVTVIETFPLNQTAVTLKFASGMKGEYFAIGKA